MGPNVSIQLVGSFFSNEALACVRLGPGGSPLSASRRTVLFGFLLFVEHVDNGIRRRHGERTRMGKNRSRGRRLHSFEHTALARWLQPSHPKAVLPGFDSNWCSWKISNTCQNFVPSLPSFSHTQHCLAILKIAYLLTLHHMKMCYTWMISMM
jgi:hypothetical protein